MSRSRRLLLVSGTAILAAVFIATVPTFRQFFDLGVYRGAVHYWLVDGGDLYDYLYQGSEYGFTYPPFAALVFSPLAAMSWPVAIAFSILLNAGAVTLILRWQFLPIARRRSWPLWTATALAFIAVVTFGPAEDTFSFGQINLILLVLVCADLQALKSRLSYWPAGLGIGLAAAIKLTPFVFIGYLILARRYRAALTAFGAFAGATLLALVIAPQSSMEFWTSTLWDTSRVGRLEYVSNQSLRGLVARLDAPATWWLAAVGVVVVFWGWCIRRRTPSISVGFALTGIVACLISPVTWVHHLVWLLPALFLLLERAVLPSTNRRALIVFGVVTVILSSSMVWLWWNSPPGVVPFLGSNAFVWVSVGLLIALPRLTATDRRSAGQSQNVSWSSMN